MNYIVKKAFIELYPNKVMDFEGRIKYSRAFKGYNANVKYTRDYKEFKLSYLWKNVSDEIKIGLIQHLLNRVYKTDVNTINIELYEIYLKKIPQLIPKIKTEPILEDSFIRMNDEYLNGMIIQPNLVWGGKNFHTLGTYSYTDDTIMISKVLQKDMHLLDYVMYHEILHKKFQYKKTGKRTIHHSKEFREWERRYKDPQIEDKLKKFLRKEKLLDSFSFF
jgi:hypothetical protein